MVGESSLSNLDQRSVSVDVGDVAITVTRVGTGRPLLVLHGGGGPMTVPAWATEFATARDAEVIVPVHPGFNGTPRPESLRTPRQLGQLYVQMFDGLGLEGSRSSATRSGSGSRPRSPRWGLRACLESWSSTQSVLSCLATPTPSA